MMRYYITDEPIGALSDTTLAAATAEGAVILHGIPPTLERTIPAGTVGLIVIPDPDPDPGPPPDLPPTEAEQIAELRAVLDALLGADNG